MTDADKYKKLSHRDHVLELPDTYIGSVETHTESRWLYDETSKKMKYEKLKFNPGFYKLFDEIVVNARDALVRSQTEKGKTPIKQISVKIGKNSNNDFYVIVENDGDGIPVSEHPEYKVYVPELIFGHLLTSGNYDKSEEKIVGGKNGYGAKLVNIFSNTFMVETHDINKGLKYQQTWSNHMSICNKPTLSKKAGKNGYVKISYSPDMTRFIDINIDDMIRVLHTRTIEIAALVGKDVKVSWNDDVILTNTFEKYVQLFVRDDRKGAICYERANDRWEVAVVLARTLYDDEESPDEHHVSFANGVNTRKGGKHVETVQKHVLTDFCESAKKKKVDVKPSQLKHSVLFFVNATIVNPSFDSQTKECLTTAANKFGSLYKCTAKFIDSLMKIGLLEEAQNILDAKAVKEAKKTDGTKKKTINGIPKLVDALWAGTAKSNECTLILTEGDSAKTAAVSGFKVVGREKWGVFPLKGKMLNVKDISQVKFNQNEELTSIKKILGLEQGKKYTTAKDLRYGRIMVMTDQDLDGSHIKGLLMNLFHTEWTSLMHIPFICSLATPLLKATKRKEVKSFFTQTEFEEWFHVHKNSGWKIKYYKGLGTSTAEEAREWFEDLHEIKYTWDDLTDDAVSLAFNKKRADDRKKWLSSYDPKRVLTLNDKREVSYTKFINDELIHFSNADNIRSLPHLMDGLKPSQRKIIYASLKRGLRSEIKVAQLAGYVSEHASYHHGEASLNSTIVGMAQTFVGSNNINLFKPIGQFGSRLSGGKDSSSERYIFTHLEPIVDVLFRKEDNGILKFMEEEGESIEPETYLPVVPLLAINGSVGIGTGFSTDIPPCNPSDIIQLIRQRINGEKTTLNGVRVKPWWYGFTGQVLPNGKPDVWYTKGSYTLNDDKKTVTINELPVGTWTEDYKIFLDSMLSETNGSGKPILKSFDDLYDDITVKFILYFESDYYEDVKADSDDFEKKFKLITTWRTSNMTCFDMKFNIVKYTSIGDILEAFYEPRLKAYEKRRISEMDRLEKEAIEADAKARFLRAILDGTMDLRKASDEDIVASMKKHKLPPISLSSNADNVDAYEYLLKLRIDRVKASAITEAEKVVMNARMSYELLRDTTGSALWLKDLVEFESAWNTMKTVREETNSDVKHGVVKKIKKIKN